MQNRLLGLDISSYQDIQDYSKLTDVHGIAFVYIKATEAYSTNSGLKRHSNGISKTGIIKGFYHYFQTEYDAVKQAQSFCDATSRFRDNMTLPDMIDIEDNTENLTPKEYQDKVSLFLRTVANITGKIPILYTNKSYFADPSKFDKLDAIAKAGYKLWCAVYNGKDYLPSSYQEFGGWSKASIWQFTDKGQIQGTKVVNGKMVNLTDMNYWMDGTDKFKEWSRCSLRKGDSGERVIWLQSKLNKRNCKEVQISIDGKFGGKTETAIKLFQKSNSLPESGMMDFETWGLLAKIKEY